ncbi:hypothetical protein B0O99DRAFT_672908 [Bisporella sp. PMI_857]|nr:hypothetical protein B0O99DRAFT_672908 [Bisporella sp. PMI_857]
MACLWLLMIAFLFNTISAQSEPNLNEVVAQLPGCTNLICNGVPQPSRSAELIRTTIIISALTFPTIALRLFSRYKLSRIWVDDWFILASGIVMIAMTILPIINATKGFGAHAWDVPPINVQTLLKTYYVSQLFYVIVQNNAKISILFFYLRIFPDPRFRLWTKILMAWIGARAFSYFIAVTFQCVPVNAVWDRRVTGQCVSFTGLVFSGAGFSIVEDIVIILLPVPVLRSLNLSLKKRIALIFMFALGSFACVTSMVRLKYIVAFSSNALDATWSNVDVVIWSIIEVYTAIICACLMVLRPLLTKYIPGLFAPSIHSSNKSYPSNSSSWRPKIDSKISGHIWSGNKYEIELLNRQDDRWEAEDGRQLRIQKTTNSKVREDMSGGTNGSENITKDGVAFEDVGMGRE